MQNHPDSCILQIGTLYEAKYNSVYYCSKLFLLSVKIKNFCIRKSKFQKIFDNFIKIAINMPKIIFQWPKIMCYFLISFFLKRNYY